MKAFKWLKKKSFWKYEQVPALRDGEDMCLRARVTFSVHCRNCANDVTKCCKDMVGVETAELDEENKVIVKGRFGREELAKRLFRRVHKLVEIESLEMEGIPGQEDEETEDHDQTNVQRPQEDDHVKELAGSSKLRLSWPDN